MKVNKEVQGLGMPWEKEYGYAQGVKVGDTVYLAGQVGHDENGNLENGMENQVRRAYANIKKLLDGFGFSMDDVVEEVLYVMDMGNSFMARARVGKEMYSDPMQVPSTLIQVSRLALDGQLVEIKIIARKM